MHPKWITSWPEGDGIGREADSGLNAKPVSDDIGDGGSDGISGDGGTQCLDGGTRI